MIHYKKYQNKKQGPTQNLWYGRVVTTETLSLEQLAEHMSKHNTPYSAGAIKGVLTDMVACIRELVMDGKAVKLPDLAIFSAGISTNGAETAKEFTAANVRRIYLRARATGTLRSQVLANDAMVREQGEYSVGNAGGDV